MDAATAPPGRRGRPGRWGLFGAVAAVAVTAAAILVPAVLMDGRDAKPAASETAAPAPSKTLNVLLIGSDARRGGDLSRSDTLVLMHVPADRKNIRAVSIPRDSLVDIPACGDGSGKTVAARRGLINTAFARGGAACALKTVESLTGVRIDQTVVIDFNGFNLASSEESRSFRAGRNRFGCVAAPAPPGPDRC